MGIHPGETPSMDKQKIRLVYSLTMPFLWAVEGIHCGSYLQLRGGSGWKIQNGSNGQ